MFLVDALFPINTRSGKEGFKKFKYQQLGYSKSTSKVILSQNKIIKYLPNLVLYFSILVFFSCSTDDYNLSVIEKIEIETSVHETLHDYLDDIRNEGLISEFKYLDNSQDFFWVPPGYSAPLSYDSIATLINENALKYKEVDNTWKSLRIKVQSKKFAIYSGHLNSKVTDTSGNVQSVELIESGFLIKRPDGWKLLGGQTNIVSDM